MIRIPNVLYDSPPDQLGRKMRKALKAALAGAVLLWHRTMLPQHFQGSAVFKYGYKPRTKKYRQRKMIKYGHTRPMVWSGRTEQLMRLFMFVRGTSRRATGKMTAPWYIAIKPVNTKAPNLKEELTKTTQAEAVSLGKFIERVMGKKFREKGPRKVVSLNV